MKSRHTCLCVRQEDSYHEKCGIKRGREMCLGNMQYNSPAEQVQRQVEVFLRWKEPQSRVVPDHHLISRKCRAIFAWAVKVEQDLLDAMEKPKGKISDKPLLHASNVVQRQPTMLRIAHLGKATPRGSAVGNGRIHACLVSCPAVNPS